jgi:hypothetical protein
VHSFFDAIITFFSLIIIKDSDAFFNYFIKIKILFIAFLASKLIPVNIVNRFPAVFSAFVKSLS